MRLFVDDAADSTDDAGDALGSLDEAGPGLEEAGRSFEDAGPGLDEAGPGFDDAGPGLDGPASDLDAFGLLLGDGLDLCVNAFKMMITFLTVTVWSQNTNKRSSAKATAGAMSPFDLQDLAICILLLGCFASDCWGSCHGHSFETRLQTTFKYFSYEP